MLASHAPASITLSFDELEALGVFVVLQRGTPIATCPCCRVQVSASELVVAGVDVSCEECAQ